MEWITALAGSIVGLDTAPLIYYIEEHPAYLPAIAPSFEAAERNEILIVTSCVTLIEVLIRPLREGRSDVANEYRNILLNPPYSEPSRSIQSSQNRPLGCEPSIQSVRRMPFNLPRR